MIICSCNVLSEKQVLSVLANAQHGRTTVSQVYAGLGCRAKCGGCTPTIKRLREEALRCGGLSAAESRRAA
jgi:bacterioferritin-associated ferredoxin